MKVPFYDAGDPPGIESLGYDHEVMEKAAEMLKGINTWALVNLGK